MEAWPVVAWALLMTSIADVLKSVHSRDFTMMDIIMLHPSTTPHPGGFKCFTCEDAADNYECNRWAPDVYCQKEARYCYTSHTMDSYGESTSVTKRCATLQDCLSTGCAYTSDSGHQVGVTSQVCSSCCEGNICNILVPKNESSAIFSSTSPLVSAGRRLQPTAPSYIALTLLFLLTAGGG